MLGKGDDLMYLFPYKRLEFYSELSREEILRRLCFVLERSKKKNFFNSTTSDHLYTGSITGNRFSIKQKTFGRSAGYPIEGYIVENNCKSILIVEIKDRITFKLIFTLAFLTFLAVLTKNIIIPLIFGSLIYAARIATFKYHVGFIEDFFQYYLLHIKK